MQKSHRWILPLILVIALCALAFNFSPIASSQGSNEPRGAKRALAPRSLFGDFDIRVRQPKKADSEGTTQSGDSSQLRLEISKQRPSAAQEARATAIIQSMRSAQERLAARVPNLKVEF